MKVLERGWSPVDGQVRRQWEELACCSPSILPQGLFSLHDATFKDFQEWVDTFSTDRQKPQPPLLLKKVTQHISHLYCHTPPICIAVLLVPLGSKEREILSVPICIAVLLPFVSQYASHLYRSTFGKILVVVVTGMFPTFISTTDRRPS